MQRIQIEYLEVQSTTANLSSSLNSKAHATINNFERVLTGLGETDGEANFELMEAVATARQKAHLTTSTTMKLISFISNSSTKMESQEMIIKRGFDLAVSAD